MRACTHARGLKGKLIVRFLLFFARNVKNTQGRGGFVRENEAKWGNFRKSAKKVIFKNVDFSMFLKFSCKKMQNF